MRLAMGTLNVLGLGNVSTLTLTLTLGSLNVLGLSNVSI